MHYFNYIGCKDAKDIKEESKLYVLLIATVIIMQNIIEIMYYVIILIILIKMYNVCYVIIEHMSIIVCL